MDNLINFATPFFSFIVTIILIILFFLFVIKPLLNYFILNREIENRKKLAKEYQVAKREAEANRHSDINEESSWESTVVAGGAEEMAEDVNKEDNSNN